MTHSVAPVLTPTTPITYPVPDSAAVITLSITDSYGYRVETTESGFTVDAWSKTYASEVDARKAARHTAQAYRLHKSAAMIERRRSQLAAILADQDRRDLRRMGSRITRADAEREYDTLLDLDSFDGRQRLTASTTLFLSGLNTDIAA